MAALPQQVCSMGKSADHCMHKLPAKKTHDPRSSACVDCPVFTSVDFQATDYSMKPLIFGMKKFASHSAEGHQGYHRLPWKPPDFPVLPLI
jgi:hypothetical protein